MSTDWTAFRLLPDDVLFFRDGKPSTRGQDHHLRSLFPPHPSTLYGALRTRRLVDHGVELRGLRHRWSGLPAELRSELGEWGDFGSLTVRGPWLVRGDEVLLPAPADLGIVPEERTDTESPAPGAGGHPGEPRPPRAATVVRFRTAETTAAGGHSHPLELLEPYERSGRGWARWPRGERPPRPAEGWYLTPAGFTAWARGTVPAPEHLVHAAELWVEEPRVGVGLQPDDRKSSDEEGLLYTFGFVRLAAGVALGFEARGTALAPGRRVRLGGEGRTALLEPGPPLPAAPAPPPEEGTDPGRLRLALATPTLSAAGGMLPGLAGRPPAGTLAGCGLRVTAAVTRGFAPVGGWDMARGGPKPLRRALPTGSVFLVEPVNGPVRPAELHGTCHADYHDDCLARQGFGLLVAGHDG